MREPVNLPHISNITVSGRIASGATSLATRLSEILNWDLLDGGKLMRKITSDLGFSLNEQDKRPDKFDLEYEERIKKMLQFEKNHVIQSHLAGYDAQGIDQVFKILVICEDRNGIDQANIRIDRLVNRDNVSVEAAKIEVKEREYNHLSKFRRLYAGNDPEWIYWDKKYYDLVVNTYILNKEESAALVLSAIKFENR